VKIELKKGVKSAAEKTTRNRLRQAYKMAALQGMKIPVEGECGWQTTIAWAAGSIADAMIAEDAKFEARS